jgi:peptidoglycan hydrolase-like protein with peptidoglycan-binding domain
MKAIRKSDKGPEVKKWQYFLIGLGYNKVIADGDFGNLTDKATKDFQQKQGLNPDGVVGNNTYSKAMQLGFELVRDDQNSSRGGINWPAAPSFKSLGATQAFKKYGGFEYKVNANRTIRILGGWEAENIVKIQTPWLKKLQPYKPDSLRVHKDVADNFIELFEAWDKAGLWSRVETFDGGFYPRLIRGHATALSSHSYGIAFDINAGTNGLGVIPPIVGRKGSVRELVPIANELGWYWGGHFQRKDGMHFEFAF